MIETVADAPAYRPDGVPVTSMVTGKVATPELVSAVRPIEPTVPLTGPFAPSVVITAGSPSLIWSTTLASTLAFDHVVGADHGDHVGGTARAAAADPPPAPGPLPTVAALRRRNRCPSPRTRPSPRSRRRRR